MVMQDRAELTEVAVYTEPTVQPTEIVHKVITATVAPKVEEGTGCSGNDKKLATEILGRIGEYNENVTTTWIEETSNMFDGFRKCDPTMVEASKASFRMGSIILMPEKIKHSMNLLERMAK